MLDPGGDADTAAIVVVTDGRGHEVGRQKVDGAGQFRIPVEGIGQFTLHVGAPGFEETSARVAVANGGVSGLIVRLSKVAAKRDSLTVVGKVGGDIVLSPDPAQRVYLPEETLAANPGRPGAPISIPGLPSETASGGIKAPQYFAPGVAGDHGEPIAQYIDVGGYLLPNNLSANAHGNGYADPNMMTPATLSGVQTDGGAFDVREGNHAENVAVVYRLRERLAPFVTVTGDYRDVDAVAGWSPEGREARSWIAVEAAYGNGLLDRLEHRQQYKLNGYREWTLGRNLLTLYGIGYYGFSYVPGLVPVHVPDLQDTVDRRQKDQTHTGLLAFNDKWALSSNQSLQMAGMFRSYNLALYSNFGDGLIRQSEFRTVAGGNAVYLKQFGSRLSLLAGADYQRDAPRRLNLDRYLSDDQAMYGAFLKETANDVTIGVAAPYLAVSGGAGRYFHYYLGWRRNEIEFVNRDLLEPQRSFDRLIGFNSPKATLDFAPGDHPWLPRVAFSFGEAFYTNDPRIGTNGGQGTLVSREHSYQLVASKMVKGTDFRVTLGHVTTEASLSKIDPDTGLQEDEGPGKNKFLTVAARRYFGFGLAEVSFSKADARDLDTGLPTPEAPRTIFDALAIVNRLPWKLEARAEFEEVGAKPLGDGFRSVPVREFRGALQRPVWGDRMSVGLHFLVASGYTGQTTEVIETAGQGGASEQVTGVRLPSYVGLSLTYRFKP